MVEEKLVLAVTTTQLLMNWLWRVAVIGILNREHLEANAEPPNVQNWLELVTEQHLKG